MSRFGSTPVFNALLHGAQDLLLDGALTVELDEPMRSEQSYDPGTAVVREHLWNDSGHGIKLIDFAPRFMNREHGFRPAVLAPQVPPPGGAAGMAGGGDARRHRAEALLSLGDRRHRGRNDELHSRIAAQRAQLDSPCCWLRDACFVERHHHRARLERRAPGLCREP